MYKIHHTTFMKYIKKKKKMDFQNLIILDERFEKNF